MESTISAFVGLCMGLLIVVPSSIWVFQDAKQTKITVDGKQYGTNNGEWAWLMSCLFIWIVMFPMYLYKRNQLPQFRQNYSRPPVVMSRPVPIMNKSSGSVADELKKFKDLLDSEVISKEEFEEQKKKLLRI